MKKRTFLSLFLLSLFFPVFADYFAPPPTYAEAGEGVRCTAQGGRPGTCWDRSSRRCNTYYDAGWYCPGDDSVQCCVDSQVACRSSTGVCHNRYTYPNFISPGSNNGNAYSCSGSWYTGYCPGPADVQCCVPAAPTATPQPPPPPTNVTATCTGTTFTVSWTPVPGYSYYYARIYDETTDVPAAYSNVLNATSYVHINAVPGRRYSYWVHTTNAAGNPYSSPVPAVRSTTVTCPYRFDQSTTTPGIIFSGNGTANFGVRGYPASSVRQWVVGGLTYPELYATAANTSSTSYQYILDRAISAQVPRLPMPCAQLTNCSLPAGLARGVYLANGSVTLNAHSFPAGNNYVFLINGDLTLNGNLVVPPGSTVLFSASRDIIVPATIGAPANTSPLPDGQIQGLFSANRNFVVQGGLTNITHCVAGPDRMLNVEGAIVVNAGGAGGAFTNNRDLCGSNPTIPSFTIRARVDFLLNMPEFLMKRATLFREDSP